MDNMNTDQDYIPDLSEFNIINEYDESNQQIHKFDSTKDIYDIISYFLEIKSSNDHFYIVDLRKIIDQYYLWKEYLPFIKPFYAVKSNPDFLIMKILSDLGCGFDCASKTEIIEAIRHINAENIIYANPCKEITHIQFARSHDVDLLVFDSETELYKIKINHPNAKLVLRIKVDDSASRCKFSSKFGYDIKDIEHIIGFVKTLGLNLVGISFHIGSNCSSNGFYTKAIADSRKVFDIALEKYNINLNLLDLGGGFPGFDAETGLTFTDIATEIKTACEEYFGEAIKNNTISIIAEPGRFFCTKSHTLACNIIGIKKIKDQEDKIINYYTINEGVYGSFSAIVFDYAKPLIKPFNERYEETLHKSVVFGPTCDSLDKITDDAMLPEMAIGDWIFVENFGAYTRASSTNFNGFQPGKVYYILSET